MLRTMPTARPIWFWLQDGITPWLSPLARPPMNSAWSESEGWSPSRAASSRSTVRSESLRRSARAIRPKGSAEAAVTGAIRYWLTSWATSACPAVVG